ncbi:NF-kappa-B-repressing factor isoform X1 [Drosophila miranda]|uniref:NF-kappa-B-repressing factor isoform X1 n=1 Tax=Drosophila miranda TaxID=7229 RepID=UPI0007E6070C|nr:NF-kappa-B-repressing factor isoform X1 [Drosophila miranda]
MASKVKKQKIETVSDDVVIPDNTITTKKQKKNKAKESDAGYGSGEFSLDWNVDDYRTEYESEEHWELRRSFMVAHKDRFEKDRMVCLAQTFVNMEFLGCKYPSETMHLVAELSKDIAEEFRRKRDQRLKRTFVSASDAAEQRAKGRSGSTKPNQRQDEQRGSTNPYSRERQCFGGGKPIDLFEGLRFGSLILYLAGGRSCLRNSCTISQIKYEERPCKEPESTEKTKYSEILVNNEAIAVGQGETLKAAKIAAFKQALFLLQTHCYSIKLNATRQTIKVEKTVNGVNINVTKESADSLGDPKLDETNKGYRMMRLMGWTGGGLGREKQGREEPVGYLLKSNRTGLGGCNKPHVNLAGYRKMIENYVKSDDMRDMQFEPTFSKEERASFHKIASKYGLRSGSYGNGESRRLLITKKVDHKTILQEVLSRRNTKFTERYFVQVPMQKAHLFPGHVASLDLEGMDD